MCNAAWIFEHGFWGMCPMNIKQGAQTPRKSHLSSSLFPSHFFLFFPSIEILFSAVEVVGKCRIVMLFYRLFFLFFGSKLTQQAEVFLTSFWSFQRARLSFCLALWQVRGSVTMWLNKSVTNSTAELEKAKKNPTSAPAQDSPKNHNLFWNRAMNMKSLCWFFGTFLDFFFFSVSRSVY